jgi:D-proline reductase (dithiol) PrdB
LVARHLEANGIPTVIIGSALDVVEHCGVPRFLFTDFPLGNPCGHPWRRDMQKAIVREALGLLEAAQGPRTTVKAPFRWKEDDPGWRARYGRVDPAERVRLLALGEERRRRRARSKSGVTMPLSSRT